VGWRPSGLWYPACGKWILLLLLLLLWRCKSIHRLEHPLNTLLCPNGFRLSLSVTLSDACWHVKLNSGYSKSVYQTPLAASFGWSYIEYKLGLVDTSTSLTSSKLCEYVYIMMYRRCRGRCHYERKAFKRANVNRRLQPTRNYKSPHRQLKVCILYSVWPTDRYRRAEMSFNIWIHAMRRAVKISLHNFLFVSKKVKTDICIAPHSKKLTAQALRCGSHSFHTARHHTCLYP